MTRAVSTQDVAEIVTVHLQGFEGFFLSYLGRDFLALLYRSLLEDRDGILIVYEENQRIAGFVAGVSCQAGFYERILRRRALGFGWAAMGALLRRPAIAPRLLRALRRPAEARRDSAEASLMSIAVRPENQGKGIGRELMRAFQEALVARRIRAFCLTTDRDNNERAHRFYRKLGLRLVTEYVTPEGRAMTEYHRNLED